MNSLDARGLAALRRALAELIEPQLRLAVDGGSSWLLAEASTRPRPAATTASRPPRSGGPGHPDPDGPPAPLEDDPGADDSELATSSLSDEAEASRLIALVELARTGDTEAFGQLYDHYHASIYRFLYYRVGSVPLAEDLTAETFFRALRGMSSFRWQGKDFGAWLMTIARNLTTDHFKAGRTRLERTTEDVTTLDSTAEGPEDAVLSLLTNEALLEALSQLPPEQRDCLVMRFLQGLSIAETAEILGRSAGAVKQLQLRGVRNLAKVLPEGLR